MMLIAIFGFIFKIDIVVCNVLKGIDMINKNTHRVYCSGPLFSPEENAAMALIADTLENEGFSTFLPQRDGLEKYVLGSINSSYMSNPLIKKMSIPINKAIFALDIYQIIEKCDCFVFNMNGRVPDEGGVVETAVAFTSGKPLIIYKNDYRSLFNGNDNSMLTGLSYTFSTVNQIKDIPDALCQSIQYIESLDPSPYHGEHMPAYVKKIVNQGRQIWQIMETIPSHMDILFEQIQSIFQN